MLEGLIIKGMSDFYYVESEGVLYTCKARGIFRKKHISPCAGDHVRFSLGADGTGAVEEILPRRNWLVRPPVANIDTLFIVSSVCQPSPNTLIIDKTIAAAEIRGIEPVVVITKTDMDDGESLRAVYEKSSITAICISAENEDGISEIREMLEGRVSVFTGNSGVGKTTLLNRLVPELNLATGDISQKLGRGRHTTRKVELFHVGSGFVADTPGFSTMDIERYGFVSKDDLPDAFREFAPYLGDCKFVSCSHTCEKGCAVLEAVRAGKIAVSRHENYVAMYNEVKDLKEWNMPKNV
ncbi:MAG: ribosome small subunit-dependent GTPase A [Clostridia bacterium]|nr:ribosome small subunit-dependent GTPase A [Clostridia bacterium]